MTFKRDHAAEIARLYVREKRLAAQVLRLRAQFDRAVRAARRSRIPTKILAAEILEAAGRPPTEQELTREEAALRQRVRKSSQRVSAAHGDVVARHARDEHAAPTTNKEQPMTDFDPFVKSRREIITEYWGPGDLVDSDDDCGDDCDPALGEPVPRGDSETSDK